MRAKRPVLHPEAQRAIEVLGVLKRAGQQRDRGVLEEVLELLRCEALALAVAACECELALSLVAEKLRCPRDTQAGVKGGAAGASAGVAGMAAVSSCEGIRDRPQGSDWNANFDCGMFSARFNVYNEAEGKDIRHPSKGC